MLAKTLNIPGSGNVSGDLHPKTRIDFANAESWEFREKPLSIQPGQSRFQIFLSVEMAGIQLRSGWAAAYMHVL